MGLRAVFVVLFLGPGCGLGLVEPSEGSNGATKDNPSDLSAMPQENSDGSSDGTSDGNQSDPNGHSTASSDPCESAWFCDDFENDTAGGSPDAPWQTELTQSTISIDNSLSYSGSQSVHVKTSANQSYTRGLIRLQNSAGLPAAGNHFFARAMLYVKAVPDAYVHWTLAEAAGPVENENFSARYRFGGQNFKRFLANYWTEPTNVANTDCWQHSDDSVLEGQWQCFEWEFDGPNNREQMWLNGQAVDNMNVQNQGQGCLGHDLDDQWMAPQFESFAIGWGHYQQSSLSHEVWIDDVVVSQSAIGCPE